MIMVAEAEAYIVLFRRMGGGGPSIRTVFRSKNNARLAALKFMMSDKFTRMGDRYEIHEARKLYETGEFGGYVAARRIEDKTLAEALATCRRKMKGSRYYK